MKFNLVFVLIGIVLLFLIFGEKENFATSSNLSKYSNLDGCTKIQDDSIESISAKCRRFSAGEIDNRSFKYLNCPKDHLGKPIIENHDGRLQCLNRQKIQFVNDKGIAPTGFVNSCVNITRVGTKGLNAKCSTLGGTVGNFNLVGADFTTCPKDKHGKYLIEYANNYLKCININLPSTQIDRLKKMGLL